jgi:hypothetical protein
MTEKKKKERVPLPHTVTLVAPIEVLANGKLDRTISEIEIKRRPRLKDLKAVGAIADKVGQNQVAIERLSGLPRIVVEEIDLEDFAALMEVIGPYFTMAEDSDEPSADALSTS